MRKRKKRWLRKLLLLLFLVLILLGVRHVFSIKKQVAQVTAWEGLVSQIATEQGLENYQDVIMAIIFTETKGNHLDLMQSSESKYGKQNEISSSEESIRLGITHLSEVLRLGQEQGVDIWTSVQAYNFGSNYIQYVAEHGGKNTVDLAESYSRDYLAPALGNDSQRSYRYLIPTSLKYQRPYLYENGGNFFYAEIVQANMTLLGFFKQLPF